MSTFEEVLDVFGGSLFPDDYRSNHDWICKHLESTSPKDENYSETSAAHDLLSSIYHAHCGDNTKATSSFKKILDHKNVLPRRWEFRCVGYQVFHLTLRRYPPIIRFRSEDWSISRWLHDNLFSLSEGVHLSHQAVQLQSEIKDGLSSNDLLESKLLFSYLMDINKLWSGFQLHPAHPLDQWLLPEFREQIASTVTAAVPKSTILIAEVFQKGFTRLAINMMLRLAGLLHGCGQADDANQLVSQTLAICIDTQDEPGQALCKMILGDMTSSPPFSSPIALNLVALDGNSYDHANQLWDTCEDGLKLTKDAAAAELYNEASHLFEKCCSHAGCAAIKLRQSGILLSQLGCSHDTSINHTHLAEIEACVDSLSRLSSKPESSAQIMKCHQVMLNVIMGKPELATRTTTDIANWCKRSGNEIIAHFIGYMMMRFARRQWKDHNRVDIALACFGCAESLFSSMNNSVSEFQAINARATVHEAIEDNAMATEVAQQGLERYDGVLAEIDRCIENSGDELLAATLPSVKNTLRSFYDFFVKSIFHLSQPNALFSIREDQAVDREAFVGDEESPESNEYDLMSQGILPNAYAGMTIQSIRQEAERNFTLGAKYRNSESESARCFSRFEVDTGMEVLRNFCLEVEATDVPWRKKVLWCVSTSFANGDQDMCLKYLSFVDEADDPLYLTSKPIFNMSVPWCRNKYDRGLRSVTQGENLLAMCVMANDWERGSRLMARIEEASPGHFDPSGPDGTIDQWKRYVWAALVAEHTGDLVTALQRNLMAEQQLDIRRSRSNGPDAKLANLSTIHIVELFLGLSRICLRCAKAQVPITALTGLWGGGPSISNWESASIMFIERGRARTLLESVSGKGISAAKSSGLDLQSELTYRRRLRRYLRSRLTAELDLDTRTGIQVELDDLDVMIERLDVSHSTTQVGLSEAYQDIRDDLYECLGQDTLFVELAFSMYESIFIVATVSGIQYTKISQLRRQDIRIPVYRALKLMNDYSRLRSESFRSGLASTEMKNCTASISYEMEQISRLILEPITNLIKSHSRIVFSAGHPFVAFPFAALPFCGKPLFISAAVSTTPSLAVYAELSSQRRSFIPEVATVTKHKLSKTEPPLPLAAIESMLIAEQFNTWPRQARKLSSAKFCEMMQNCTIMHIGTHGAMYADSPWLSYISLKKQFRVIDLSNARGKVSLMVFGACQSGLGIAEGDETLGFSNAILQTGAMAYLGALWEVDDVATMILMIYFYRNIRLQPTTSGRALTDLWKCSMEAFYNTNEAMARSIIQEFVNDLSRCRERGRNPDTILDGAEKVLLSLLEKDIDVDFKHPYFYGSFALTGFGGLVCELPQAV